MRRHLLLAGGGHAHLFVLESLYRRQTEWRERLDVTLLTRNRRLAYSGMLPGLIAGHYRSSQCHVDLAPLAERCGIRLIEATADRLDPVRQLLHAQDIPLRYDLLSLNVGATVAIDAPGAQGRALGLRPVDVFLAEWQRLETMIDRLQRPVHLIMVGGGAGGIEVALAMAHRLRAHRDRLKLSLVTRGLLLPNYPRKAAERIARQLARAGIAVRTNAHVERVEDGVLHLADGSVAAFDALCWSTGAAPQSWLAQSGLACVDGGFVHINSCLQSVSHPDVFAAGDIACNPLHKHPKAGVFAVRQGPVLADNLLRRAAGLPLSRMSPQSAYLSLLATGDRHAMGCWRGLVWEGDWVWRWKDRIDRRFMQRFSE